MYPPSFIRIRSGLVLFVKAHEDLITYGIVPLGFPSKVFNEAASHTYQKIMYSVSFTRVLSHWVFLSKVLTRHILKEETDI